MTPGERPAPPLDRSYVIEHRRFVRHRIEGNDAEHWNMRARVAAGAVRDWARSEGYRVLDTVSATEQDDGTYIVELEVGAPESAGPDDGYALGDPKGWKR